MQVHPNRSAVSKRRKPEGRGVGANGRACRHASASSPQPLPSPAYEPTQAAKLQSKHAPWKDMTKDEAGLPTPDTTFSWSPPWVLPLPLPLPLLLLEAAMLSGCGGMRLPALLFVELKLA